MATDRERAREHALENRIQSALLVGSMTGLFVLLAWLLAGGCGAVGALLVAALLWAFTPRFSPALVLRAYRARPLAPAEAPELYGVAAELARRARLPVVPALHYLPSDVMNAFAVGSGARAGIALSDGLLRRLSLPEVAGVLAHEVAHVQHDDTRVMALADVTGRVTSALATVGRLLLLVNLPLFLFGMATVSWWVVLALLVAPTVSTLVQLALSRTREFHADVTAAELLGDPRPLASALVKLEQYQRRLAALVLWPVQRLPDPCLLRTHPKTEERVERLLALARTEQPLPVTAGAPRTRYLAAAPVPARRHWSGEWF